MSAPKTPIAYDPFNPLGQPDPSLKEAGAMLNVSERSVRRLVEKGEVEAYKLLDSTRVRLPSLRLYLDKCRSKPIKLSPPPRAGEKKRPVGRPKKPKPEAATAAPE